VYRFASAGDLDLLIAEAQANVANVDVEVFATSSVLLAIAKDAGHSSSLIERRTARLAVVVGDRADALEASAQKYWSAFLHKSPWLPPLE
jgi:hypothetical protein